MTTVTRRELTGWRKLAVDLGPLLLFFAAYSRFDMFVATAVFMAAVAVAMAVSWAITRHIPAMSWFSAVLVGVFGGLTLWLKDETFIKMKPTIVYLIFAAILFFGLARRRNYLKSLLGAAFEGLSDLGWSRLTWRWAIFFLVLAALNEAFWRLFSTDVWMHFKVWGDSLLTFAFAIAQMPMLLKHGLSLEDGKGGGGNDRPPPSE
ncbi:septation protein A [Sandaracinobacteroides sp. A072]|uniref:septation protein A n=1 Tax=Sandaracinobacteroides sp. A072 TaxID=3461146 RepID=UPI0040412986